MAEPVFYVYPYAHMREAEFEIRLGGVRFRFLCKRLVGSAKRIRRALAVLIREKVITAQGGQWWGLNRRGTRWRFHAGERVASVPSHEVYWGLSDSRNLIETYEHGRLTKWAIVKKIGACYHCDSPYEVKHAYGGPQVQPAEMDDRGRWVFWTCLCDKCRERMERAGHRAFGKNLPERTVWDRLGRWWRLLRRKEIVKIANQD